MAFQNVMLTLLLSGKNQLTDARDFLQDVNSWVELKIIMVLTGNVL